MAEDCCSFLNEFGGFIRNCQIETLNSNIPADLRELATKYRDFMELMRDKYNGVAAECEGYEHIPAFDPIPE